MAEWVGALLGSLIGLIAILLGALYNAKLTRKRDDKIMNDEAKSIAAAIGAEMGVYTVMLCRLFMQARVPPEPGRSMALVRAMRAPDLMVWPELAGKVGVLGADLAGRTVKNWMVLLMHARMLQASVDDIVAGEWDDEKVRSRADFLKMDLPSVADTVEELTGNRPDFDYLLP
ncbi:hypothetical protein [Pusillimonas sp. NJUB218]|uniref:hypothetical protein n=1 Tax=Pusillimonas sp. NJUB218 TaxID=2023230 RepID=UPI000F4CB97A|nr:hypothetical protein [Pusillimonas sp. NJUB218]ROT44998.1 hypothetical protein CHR62_09100 [Pusillimonas sp. NJUB218]